MKKKNRVFSLLLCVVLLLGLLPAAALAAEEGSLDNFTRTKEYREGLFTDVSPENWFYGSVRSAYELGLMQGSGDRFDPSGKVTLAETVTVAARLHAIYYTGGESFASGSPWYQPYVDYALDNGILAASFADYGRAATRAEYAVILAAALPAEALPAINTVADDAIPDVKCADACGPAVYALYRAGVLTGGDKKGTFSPRSTIARSEVTAIVSRMADRAQRQTITLTAGTAPEAFGTYTLKNRQGKYLSCSGNTLTLSDKSHRWYVAPTGDGNFHIKNDENPDLMLDISNAWYDEGNSVGLFWHTQYTAQHWNFEEHAPGEYLIVSAEDPSFVLAPGKGGLVISPRDKAGDGAVWTAELVERPNVFTSRRGIMTILLEDRAVALLGEKRAQKLIDDLELAYDAFAELSGPSEYKTVVIYAEGYAEYWGYYLGGTNEIHINNNELYDDLQKMVKRKNDWNFGLLHELGHLFDDKANWDFDCEMMTDLKMLYVLDKYNAGAAVADYPAETVFTGMDEMIGSAHELGGYLEDGYQVFNMVAKFGEIAQEIGWESFKQTFRAFPDMGDSTVTERFEKFVELLGQYSGSDVRGMFSAKEWTAVCKEYANW